MFRSFVLFIAPHYYFSGYDIFPYFKFFYVTFFICTYYLALSISRLLLFIFSFVISYFPYFKLVTVKTLVILCNTLNKEGRAFRNIGKKYIPLVNSQLRLLHFQLFDWLKNSDYEPIVGVLRHMENSVPSLKIFRTKFLTSALHN